MSRHLTYLRSSVSFVNKHLNTVKEPLEFVQVTFILKMITGFFFCAQQHMSAWFLQGHVFSRDVTAAMLVSLNKGTAAMLMSPTNPPGIELY